MFGDLKAVKNQIYVQGDFVTFGYGGFYTIPKGWGMDIAYINISSLKGIGGKRRVKAFIKKKIAVLVGNGLMSELFLPNFLSKFFHICRYEWEYEKARLFFEFAKAKVPAYSRYEDFHQFAKECIGGNYGISPIDLAAIVEERVSSVCKLNKEQALGAQKFLQTRHAEDVLKRVFSDIFGDEEGRELGNEVRDVAGEHLSINPESEGFAFFKSSEFTSLISAWHKAHIEAYCQDEYLDSAIKNLSVTSGRGKHTKKAYRDTVRGLKELPKEQIALLKEMHSPIFVATGDSANYFRGFFTSIPLAVIKDEEEMKEFTVFGLCMYQRFRLGGVIVTHGGREYQRFWHTLCEEVTHLSDGPLDRYNMKGHHRYSGHNAFKAAYEKDRAATPSWDRTGVLGGKEWAQLLTRRKVNRFTAQKVQKRIDMFDAGFAFDHYPPEQRLAEIFAALPIAERAVGKARIRKTFPHMFGFYDGVYLKGLKQELKELKSR
jgi:hypothetical protein